MRKIKFSLFSLFIVICLVVSGSPVALAQEGETEEAKAVYVLDEITITAERRETNMQDTPTAVTAVGAKALETIGISDHDDLMNYVVV